MEERILNQIKSKSGFTLKQMILYYEVHHNSTSGKSIIDGTIIIIYRGSPKLINQ